MIDRITIPSLPTWSKCDFASLGLRPQMMLKLVRKPSPPGDGPHGFADQFDTVLVENPETFPWLATGGGSRPVWRDSADPVQGAQPDADDDDFDRYGMPAHLDVNADDLFLRSDDNVIPGLNDDGIDMEPDMDGEFRVSDLREDSAEMPTSVNDVGIGYSRNSKFVDVKTVKKNLWDNMSADIERAVAPSGSGKASTSFKKLCTRSVKRMSETECENLSAQVCFICVLHLCNEKGLELKLPSDGSSDFSVVGPASINQAEALAELDALNAEAAKIKAAEDAVLQAKREAQAERRRLLEEKKMATAAKKQEKADRMQARFDQRDAKHAIKKVRIGARGSKETIKSALKCE